jgi:hypothetical protein
VTNILGRLALAAFLSISGRLTAEAGLRVATFQVDVTPPIGSPLCDGLCPPAASVSDPLSARGLVLAADDQAPVVLVALDWVGVGNDGHEAWRGAVAEACGVEADRACVNCLHQHDAPGCDFQAEKIAAGEGLAGKMFPVDFARDAIVRTATAAREAASQLRDVTHVGYGLAPVEQVASNRRILGPDGKVQFVRYTACKDPEIRAKPEGLFDPMVRLVSFWHEDEPLAVLSYYATHPQSYYGGGVVSADFVGMARDQRQREQGAGLHIHFNGAGGNIGSGKYNDGSPENRPVLAARLAEGMRKAWEATERIEARELSLDWRTTDVALPVAEWYDQATSEAELRDANSGEVRRLQAARAIAWGRRVEQGDEICLARLRLGPIDIMHMPGELFVEYQLAAQRLRPASFVCMAAYGDYGPGYIGTAEAYSQGGYETGLESRASRVSPRSEAVLMNALEELLE